MRAFLAFLLVSCVSAGVLRAQAVLDFDAVSIKRNNSGPAAGGGIDSLPDGSYIMTNQPISSMIRYASPVAVRDVLGLPTWATEDRYDVIAKPPSGSTAPQRKQMWQKMFAERMKLVAHVEDREINAFGLKLARPDGRLGPQLKSAGPECLPRPPAASEPARPEPPSRCGVSFGASRIEAGAMTMDVLAQMLTRLAGRVINNRTGLRGFYELQLEFSAELKSPDSEATAGDTLPDVFTAAREQLGLRLDPEKARVPVFVVDSIQRPSEN